MSIDEFQALVNLARTPDVDRARRQEAFGELVRRFQDMAYGCALAVLGEPYLAEDAAQEAFLLAYQHLPQLREPAAFPGWLRRIVLSQCARLTRRKQVPTQPIETVPNLAAQYPTPLALVETHELQEQVTVALWALPQNQRLATVLYYIDGYSQQEVAEFLGVPLTSVKKWLERARKRLRERMTEMVQDNLHQTRPSNDDRFVQTIRLSMLMEAAALERQVDMIELLLLDGINVNAAYENGQTLLHWAAMAGHPDAVELLLQHNADRNLRDQAGKTPLQWASERGHQDVIELLRHR